MICARFFQAIPQLSNHSLCSHEFCNVAAKKLKKYFRQIAPRQNGQIMHQGENNSAFTDAQKHAE
jgi:hypothetical protein